MNSKVVKFGLVIAIVAALAVSAVAVGAQQQNGQGQGRGWGDERGMGFGMGFADPEHSAIAIAAETLGMEQADLVAELQAGKSVADVATEKGVELSTIIDAIVAQHTEQMKAAVEAGDITQEEVDAMTVLMRAQITRRLSASFEQFTPVDEDGDGLCDNCPMPGQGNGMPGMMGNGMHGMMDGGMMGGMHGHGMMQGMQGMMGNGMPGMMGNQMPPCDGAPQNGMNGGNGMNGMNGMNGGGNGGGQPAPDASGS